MRYDFHNKQFAETDTSPDKLAIAGSDKDISWNQLKERAEFLASELKRMNIPQGHPVIIYGHKEHTYLVAMLGCIHASIPYVPADIIYPTDRIRTIATKTGSQVLINCTDTKLDVDFPILFDKEFKVVKAETADFKDRIYGEASDPLQYIIFTSGSTGEPKGVQITRDAAIMFTDWLKNDYGFSGNEVFINQAPFTFDLSMYDVLSTFVTGGSIVLNKAELFKDPDAFLARIKKYNCTVWFSTPSFVFIYLRHPEFKKENLPSLKTFLFIGEELPNRTPKVLLQLFNESRVLNAYGPTEATVATTLIEITNEIIEKCPSLPIGYAMPGSKLWIDNKETGSKEGELIISGDHVSIGYFKDPELNAKKYFMHEGKRAFRTGDLAWYEGDVLFFTGRNDDQVKMHGFRIELTEISFALCKHEAVSEAVSIPLKRNTEVKKIVSYVILKKDAIVSKEELIQFLEKSLPYYMIPGDIVIVNEFPYNNNHKIDKKKLADLYIETQTS